MHFLLFSIYRICLISSRQRRTTWPYGDVSCTEYFFICSSKLRGVFGAPIGNPSPSCHTNKKQNDCVYIHMQIEIYIKLKIKEAQTSLEIRKMELSIMEAQRRTDELDDKLKKEHTKPPGTNPSIHV